MSRKQVVIVVCDGCLIEAQAVHDDAPPRWTRHATPSKHRDYCESCSDAIDRFLFSKARVDVYVLGHGIPSELAELERRRAP